MCISFIPYIRNAILRGNDQSLQSMGYKTRMTKLFHRSTKLYSNQKIMKKIISILIAFSVLCCFVTEAKTTKNSGRKKSATAATNFSKSGFVPSLIVRKSHGTYEINPNLAKDLQNNGFSLIESKVESLECDSGEPDDEGSYMDFLVSYFKDPKIGVAIKISNFLEDGRIYDVRITFSSSSSEKNFVSNLLKMGYKKEVYKSGYIDYGPPLNKGNLIRVGYGKGEYTVYYGG